MAVTIQTFRNEFYTLLSGTATLTAVVGTRIYPWQFPQGVASPALAYWVADSEMVGSHDGDRSLMELTITINILHDNDPMICDTVRDILAELLDHKRITLTTYVIGYSKLVDEQDLHDPEVELYVKAFTYRFLVQQGA